MITWRKSDHSNDYEGSCVELGALDRGEVGVRDSKAPGDGHLTITASEFAVLVDLVRHRVDPSGVGVASSASGRAVV
ncbi:DUF397 domain-containing protein [Actinomadura gamaensis]|uniref:DUF397 domain-containing protein n=1 Tax=Actinomadura gamaensis TaxID=1763541 RepID=A0ABV9U7U3_9ACTN